MEADGSQWRWKSITIGSSWRLKSPPIRSSWGRRGPTNRSSWRWRSPPIRSFRRWRSLNNRPIGGEEVLLSVPPEDGGVHILAPPGSEGGWLRLMEADRGWRTEEVDFDKDWTSLENWSGWSATCLFTRLESLAWSQQGFSLYAETVIYEPKLRSDESLSIFWLLKPSEKWHWKL